MRQEVNLSRLRAFSQQDWRRRHFPPGQGMLCAALTCFWLAEKLDAHSPLCQIEQPAAALLRHLAHLQSQSYYPAFREDFVPCDRELSLLEKKYGSRDWQAIRQLVAAQYQGDYALYDLARLFRYETASITRYTCLPQTFPGLRSLPAGTAVIGLLRYLDKGKPRGHRVAYYRDREYRHHFFDPNHGELMESDHAGFHQWMDRFLRTASYRKFEPSASDAFLTLYQLRNVSRNEVPDRERDQHHFLAL